MAALPDSLRQEIDRLAEEYLSAKGSVGLVVGILYRGQEHLLGYGRLSLDTDRPPDGDSLFEIASITKTFTAALLAEMALHGEVRLDDPLQKHLPEGIRVPVCRGKEIVLVHLATHLSGLPGAPPNIRWAEDGDPWGRYTEKELYEAVAQTRARAAPGERGTYSNFGMGLLGNVLGRVHGGGYEAAVVERICDPLGMPDTRITLTAEQEARFVPGHAGGKPTPHWTTPALPGCGALRSTARDMLRYLAGYLGEAPLPLREALQECLRSRGRSSPPRPVRERVALTGALFTAWLAIHFWMAPPPGPVASGYLHFGIPVAIGGWLGGMGTGVAVTLLIAAAELLLWTLPGGDAAPHRVPLVTAGTGALFAWVFSFMHRIAAREEVGLGWFRSPLAVGDARVWWHNGRTGGFATFAGLVEESGSALVVLSNASNSVDSAALRMLRALHKASISADQHSRL